MCSVTLVSEVNCALLCVQCVLYCIGNLHTEVLATAGNGCLAGEVGGKVQGSRRVEEMRP